MPLCEELGYVPSEKYAHQVGNPVCFLDKNILVKSPLCIHFPSTSTSTSTSTICLNLKTVINYQPEMLRHSQMIAEKYGLYENACLGMHASHAI